MSSPSRGGGNGNYVSSSAIESFETVFLHCRIIVKVISQVSPADPLRDKIRATFDESLFLDALETFVTLLLQL